MSISLSKKKASILPMPSFSELQLYTTILDLQLFIEVMEKNHLKVLKRWCENFKAMGGDFAVIGVDECASPGEAQAQALLEGGQREM